MEIETYNYLRNGGPGFYEQKRGLIAVWGKEAVQFLDGLITNDMKTLADGAQILAAFPNAQGRLLAVVRVLRQGDRFLFETEEATREKVFQNLFRFTFAGDFFVENLSDNFRYFDLFGATKLPESSENVYYKSTTATGCFIKSESADAFCRELTERGACKIDEELYETLRIENGVPRYGVDMDETTIVPELGLDGMISYNKGCYIGQEIIARIHFRGHVAKRMTGLVLSQPPVKEPVELQNAEGKNAGRITSQTYSPVLDQHIALAFVRYDYLSPGTQLNVGGQTATVTDLPFVKP